MGDTTVTVEDVMEQLGVALRENVLLSVRVRKLEAALTAAQGEERPDGDR